MKVKEQEFLMAVQSKSDDKFVRDIVKEFQSSGVPIKRLWYWLEKWTDKGWYDYGASPDLGWLTDDGKQVLVNQGS